RRVFNNDLTPAFCIVRMASDPRCGPELQKAPPRRRRWRLNPTKTCTAGRAVLLVLLASGGFAGEAEAIERAVVISQVNASVGYRDAGEVVERLDCVAARPELLAGHCVEHVDDGVPGFCGADSGIEVESDVRPCLLRILATAVSENHAIRNDGGFAAVHVAGNPHRFERGIAGVADDLEGCFAAFFCRGLVGRWEFDGRIRRAPEGNENPTGATRILPAGERAPTAGVLKVGADVAEERSLVERGVMVRAAGVFRIEQEHSAFLTRGSHQLAALIVENGWRVVGIEVAMPEPCPVRGREPVPGLPDAVFHAESDHAVRNDQVIGIADIDVTVARGGPNGALRVDRGTAAPP